MASGTLQEDGEYVVRTKDEEAAKPVPDLNSACGRAEATTMQEPNGETN